MTPVAQMKHTSRGSFQTFDQKEKYENETNYLPRSFVSLYDGNERLREGRKPAAS